MMQKATKMNRIEQRFRKLRQEQKKAFLAFITCGDPKMAVTERLALEFDRLGVDILELGVPFSDPLADGPTIQAASQRALKNKIKLDDVFRLVRRLRLKTEIPIVLLTYYNIIFRFGIKKFILQASAAGVDGVIVPDLPVEESADLVSAAKGKRFCTIFLIAPTSDRQRIKRICAKACGFIYYVSTTGTTGARTALPVKLLSQLRGLKQLTDKPVCVGFGVSTAAQAKTIARYCDGVIVGSVIIKIIEKNLNKPGLVDQVVKFTRSIRQAI